MIQSVSRLIKPVKLNSFGSFLIASLYSATSIYWFSNLSELIGAVVVHPFICKKRQAFHIFVVKLRYPSRRVVDILMSRPCAAIAARWP